MTEWLKGLFRPRACPSRFGQPHPPASGHVVLINTFSSLPHGTYIEQLAKLMPGRVHAVSVTDKMDQVFEEQQQSVTPQHLVMPRELLNPSDLPEHPLKQALDAVLGTALKVCGLAIGV